MKNRLRTFMGVTLLSSLIASFTYFNSSSIYKAIINARIDHNLRYLTSRYFSLDEKDVQNEVRKWGDWYVPFMGRLSFLSRTSKDMNKNYAVYYPSYRRIELQLMEFNTEELEKLIATKLSEKNKSLFNINKSSLEFLIERNNVLEDILSEVNTKLEKIKGYIDHEVAHAVLDPTNKLYSLKDFSCPSKNEIKNLVLKLYDSKKHHSYLNNLYSVYLKKYPYPVPLVLYMLSSEKESDGVRVFLNTDLPIKNISEDMTRRSYNLLVGEVFARMVDSLMSVYLGPTTRDLWELSDKEIELLSKFKITDKLLFEKNIEKYSIAKKLKKQGVNWKVIQKNLEYATKFYFDGKHYSWPENSYTLDKLVIVR